MDTDRRRVELGLRFVVDGTATRHRRWPSATRARLPWPANQRAGGSRLRVVTKCRSIQHIVGATPLHAQQRRYEPNKTLLSWRRRASSCCCSRSPCLQPPAAAAPRPSSAGSPWRWPSGLPPTCKSQSNLSEPSLIRIKLWCFGMECWCTHAVTTIGGSIPSLSAVSASATVVAMPPSRSISRSRNRCARAVA